MPTKPTAEEPKIIHLCGTGGTTMASTDGAAGARKVRIFLSYKMEDENRATHLETVLRAAGEGRIDVFRARTLSFAHDWNRKLKETIGQSDLFILLYTDPITRDWGWSLLECGLFMHNVGVINGSVICLHHPNVQPPEWLRHFKTIKANKEDARELLMYILLRYPERHGMEPINVDLFMQRDKSRQQMLDLYCAQIVKVAGEATAQFYVHDARLEMNVRPEDVFVTGESLGRDTYDVRSEVCVKLSLPLAACLEFNATSATWKLLKKSSINDYRWLDSLACAIYAFIHEGEDSLRDEPILETFRSDVNSRLYRPYLHQIEKGADGRVRFDVFFIEE